MGGERTSYFHHHDEDGRARLDFGAVEKRWPELADRVRLVRSRAKDLEANFSTDSSWALNRFNRLTYATMFFSVCAAVLGAAMGFSDEASLVSPSGLAVGTIALLLAAGSQAFGWHKRFGAMFAARWAMTALVTRIDQTIVQTAMSAEPVGELTEAARTQLDGAIDAWVEEMGETMKLFGTSYGNSVAPITVPNALGHSN